MRAVCPNCGYAENRIAAKQAQAGQRVLIDRLPLAMDSAQRWDLVAFYPPGEEQKLAVKRVVGLPGEELAIREGDVFIDGRRLRKTLDQQQALSVLVHDNDYLPGGESQLPSRWRSDREETRWQEITGGFRIAPADDAPAATLDWLSYRHWRCTPNPLPRSDEEPVRDNYGYNQGLSRHLQVVLDLMLVCRVELAGGGQLLFLGHDGHESWEIEIEPEQQRLALRRQGKLVDAADWPATTGGQPLDLVFSLFDRQLILAVDGQTLLSRPLPVAPGPLQPTSRPFAIAASALTAEITGLQIYRDVYYLDPTNRLGDWLPGLRLGKDEYFLLGDNVPLSRDSRSLPSAVTRKSLIGKVLAF